MRIYPQLSSMLLFCKIAGILLIAVTIAEANAAPLIHPQKADKSAHYAATAPKTTEQALALLHSAYRTIAENMQKASLTPANLEAIHEQSYLLEAALGKLQQDDSYAPELIETISIQTERLHHASEHHNASKTRNAFEALSQSITAFDTELCDL